MLNISFWEAGIVIIVALLVFGPDRLPKIARTAGHWLGRGRRLWATVKKESKDTLDDIEGDVPPKKSSKARRKKKK